MNHLAENKLILTICEEEFEEFWVGYINNKGEKVFKVSNELKYEDALKIFNDLNGK